MAGKHDIGIYLDAMNVPFEEIADDFWRVESPEDRVTNIMIQFSEPILILTIRMFKVPENVDAAFYRRLLIMNSMEITHGAFAIDEDNYVILIDTLELENLDNNELKASIQSIAFTTVQCYKEFSDIIKVS